MRKALPSVLSVISAIAVCFIAAGLTRDFGTAIDAFIAMLWGAFGDWPKFAETGASATVLRPLGEAATKAGILTFTGLSVTVAFRVGLFNIGAQGQLVVGALAAAVVGAQVEAPAIIHVPLCLLAAAAAGALYALGPMTRGAFWEIVAVPDIRQQTWNLARRLSNAHWVGGEGL